MNSASYVPTRQTRPTVSGTLELIPPESRFRCAGGRAPSVGKCSWDWCCWRRFRLPCLRCCWSGCRDAICATTRMQRLASQATFCGLPGPGSHARKSPRVAGALAVRMMGKAPSVTQAKVTDSSGNVLVRHPWLDQQDVPRCGGNSPDPPHPRYSGTDLHLRERSIGRRGADLHRYPPAGFCMGRERSRLGSGTILIVVRGTLTFGLVWILASTVLVWFVSRSISRPLAILHAGTAP